MRERTIKKQNPIQYKEINVNGVTLDLHLSLVKYQNNSIELTRNEFLLLYYFFINPKKIILTKTLSERLEKEEI